MKARRVLGGAALGLAAAGAAASPLWGPPALRRVPLFDAARVEVAGTRLLAPHEVVAASGIRMGASVWTDPAPWEAALRAHPVIASATVRRRLPATLRIRVVEKRPVAFVQAGTLRPATARGEILPLDPARVPVDLPIAGRAPDTARAVRDGATLALLREAGRLAEADPMLLARVSELRTAPDGAVRLLLSAPDAEVLLPPGSGGARLAQLRATLDHVAPRVHPGGSATLDARFADQVVVRLAPPAAAIVPRPVP